jgi:hypothetical protein
MPQLISSTVVPRIRLVSATRPYRRIIDDHAPARRYLLGGMTVRPHSQLKQSRKAARPKHAAAELETFPQ